MVTEWFSTNRFQAKFHGIDPPIRSVLSRCCASTPATWPTTGRTSSASPSILIATHAHGRRQAGVRLLAVRPLGGGLLETPGAWICSRPASSPSFGEGGWSSREIVLRGFPVKDEANGRIHHDAGPGVPAAVPAGPGAAPPRTRWLGQDRLPHRRRALQPQRHELARGLGLRPPLRPEISAEWTPSRRPTAWTAWRSGSPSSTTSRTWQDAYEDARSRATKCGSTRWASSRAARCPNKTVDVPLIESRTLHWLNYRYGLKGYLHWGFNAWTDDPSKPPGQHRGDGWHVYPKNDGLLNSLRWEQMRNGIQDYECLWLLEDKIRQMQGRMSPRVSPLIDPSRRGVEIASRSSGPDRLQQRAQVLYAARRQAIEETLDLDRSPRVIVQTNPLEHSPVANNATIDVHGWAEPGTRITINGTEVPVAADGLFLENVRISRERRHRRSPAARMQGGRSCGISSPRVSLLTTDSPDQRSGFMGEWQEVLAITVHRQASGDPSDAALARVSRMRRAVRHTVLQARVARGDVRAGRSRFVLSGLRRTVPGDRARDRR